MKSGSGGRVRWGHRRLATNYDLLRQYLEAGVPLIDALRQLGSRDHGFGVVAVQMIARLERGASASDAFRSVAPNLPAEDCLVLAAAADAGRLPELLAILRERHRELHTARLRALMACAYPAAVLHVLLLLAPIVRMLDFEHGVQWDTLAYASEALLWVGGLWGLLFVARCAARIWPVAARACLAQLPLIGAYLRWRATADVAFTLSHLVHAGVRIDSAWAQVSAVTPAPNLALGAEAMAATAARGVPPGQRMAQWPCFPPEFVALYRTGEPSGSLDAALGRIGILYHERARTALTAATWIYPAVLFVAVAATMAVAILRTYAAYLHALEKLT